MLNLTLLTKVFDVNQHGFENFTMFVLNYCFIRFIRPCKIVQLTLLSLFTFKRLSNEHTCSPNVLARCQNRYFPNLSQVRLLAWVYLFQLFYLSQGQKLMAKNYMLRLLKPFKLVYFYTKFTHVKRIQ